MANSQLWTLIGTVPPLLKAAVPLPNPSTKGEIAAWMRRCPDEAGAFGEALAAYLTPDKLVVGGAALLVAGLDETVYGEMVAAAQDAAAGVPIVCDSPAALDADTVGKLGDGTLLKLLKEYGPEIIALLKILLPLFLAKPTPAPAEG